MYIGCPTYKSMEDKNKSIVWFTSLIWSPQQLIKEICQCFTKKSTNTDTLQHDTSTILWRWIIIVSFLNIFSIVWQGVDVPYLEREANMIDVGKFLFFFVMLTYSLNNLDENGMKCDILLSENGTDYHGTHALWLIMVSGTFPNVH